MNFVSKSRKIAELETESENKGFTISVVMMVIQQLLTIIIVFLAVTISEHFFTPI